MCLTPPKEITLHNPTPSRVTLLRYSYTPKLPALGQATTKTPLVIEPRSSQSLIVPLPKDPSVYIVNASLETDHEVITLPIKFGRQEGMNFYPDEISFPPSFPGIVRNISVSSFLMGPESLTLRATCTDPRIVPGTQPPYLCHNSFSVIRKSFIEPGRNVTLLDVLFDPSVGFPQTESVHETSSFNLFQKKREQELAWRKTNDLGRDKIDTVITIVANNQEFTIPVRGILQRPLILR